MVAQVAASVACTVAKYTVLPTLASVLTTILDYWTWHEEGDADLMRGEMLLLRELVSTSPPVWPSPYSVDMEKNLMRNCRGLSISYKCKYSSSLLEFVKRSHQTSPAILTSQRDRHRKPVKNIPFVLHCLDPEIKA